MEKKSLHGQTRGTDLEKMTAMLYTNPGAYKLEHSFNNVNYFKNGQYTFYISFLRECFDSLRDMEYAYGVLPMPKYDEKQKDYYTVVDGGADILTVPATAQNTDMIGAAVEALSALSYKEVLPAYINMALEQKGTRDEESIEMLRSILDSRVIDFSYLYDCGKGWIGKLPKIIVNAESISSTIASNQSAMETYWNDTITYLTTE